MATLRSNANFLVALKPAMPFLSNKMIPDEKLKDTARSFFFGPLRVENW